MARLVLGMGSSHGPMLSTPPGMWHLRADADKKNSRHFYRGEAYDYAGLLAARQPGFAAEITPEERQRRYDACQRALDALAAKYREVHPDVVVIVGNDQREVFQDDLSPAIAVYSGSEIQNVPLTETQRAKLPAGVAVAEEGHCPPGGAVYRGAPDRATALIRSLVEQEFDIAQCSRLPPEHGIPHAFGFLYRRIMADNPPPSVPVFLNVGVPENQPGVARCLKLGRALRHAIESWTDDATVALLGSGGWTHFVIDEPLDRQVLKAMQECDEASLATIPEKRLLGNTAEIKNWLPVAGAMNAASKTMTVVDYVPCYRTEAGTGNAMAFAYWQ
jgi:hypothetical protein